MRPPLLTWLFCLLSAAPVVAAFRSLQVGGIRIETRNVQRRSGIILFQKKDSGDEKYRNAITEVFSNFMQESKPKEESLIDAIDWDAPKIAKNDLETLAAALDAELYEREWFVTGNVNPIYFDDRFEFQDPDVKVKGIEEYARGVKKLFDQDVSRAEIISTVVNPSTPNTITCTWRLSGKVNIGPGLDIKPYIVETDFLVDSETGLVVFQEDRFDIPGWDIIASALFPFLIGKLTAPPAPPVEPRVVKFPKLKTASSAKKQFWW